MIDRSAFLSSLRLVMVALLSVIVAAGATNAQQVPDRTLIVLRGDASLTIEDGESSFDVGEEGEIAEVQMRTVPRGFLGAQVQELSPELRLHFGAPEDAGVLVSKVEVGSPADLGGLRTGDVLTAIDGIPVQTRLGFHRFERKLDEADVVALTFLRDRSYHQETAVATERDRPEVDVRSVVRSFGEGVGSGAYEIDVEALELELERIQKAFDGKAWQAQVEELQQLEGRLESHLKSLNVEIHRMELEVDPEDEEGEPR
jgi:hypothetical protein